MALKQKTLQLSEPVEFAGITYDKLTFQRLKAKHLLGINTGNVTDPVEQSYALAAASAGVDIGVIFELDLADVAAMNDILADFFPPALLAKAQPAQGTSPPT